jgi:hypothetical protein
VRGSADAAGASSWVAPHLSSRSSIRPIQAGRLRRVSRYASCCSPTMSLSGLTIFAAAEDEVVVAAGFQRTLIE